MESRSSLIASLVIVIIVFGAVGGLLYTTSPYEPSRVAVVVMEPGFGDLSYADQLMRGLQALAADIPVQYAIQDPVDTPAEGQQLLEQLAASGRYSLILVLGPELQDPLNNVAAAYPEQDFGMIDGIVPRENVFSSTFRTYEASFVAGVFAALMADNLTHIVGVIGSVEADPRVANMIDGFIQGVNRAKNDMALDVDVLEPEFVGSYNDTYTAGNMTYNMFIQKEASIIFAPVRASITGVRLGMLEANHSLSSLYNLTKQEKYDRKPLVIAAEGDQDYYGLPDPEVESGESWIPLSVVPRTDLAAYRVINATLWQDFPGAQEVIYDLANGGVNITDFTYSTQYTDPYRPIVWDYYHAVVNGTIVVQPNP